MYNHNMSDSINKFTTPLTKIIYNINGQTSLSYILHSIKTDSSNIDCNQNHKRNLKKLLMEEYLL